MKEEMEPVKHSSVAAWFHCGISREEKGSEGTES